MSRHRRNHNASIIHKSVSVGDNARGEHEGILCTRNFIMLLNSAMSAHDIYVHCVVSVNEKAPLGSRNRYAFEDHL